MINSCWGNGELHQVVVAQMLYTRFIAWHMTSPHVVIWASGILWTRSIITSTGLSTIKMWQPTAEFVKCAKKFGKPNRNAPLQPIIVMEDPFPKVITLTASVLVLRPRLTYLFTIMDVAVSFPVAVLLRMILARNVSRHLLDTTFGLPTVVQLDQGTNLNSEVFQKVMCEPSKRYNHEACFKRHMGMINYGLGGSSPQVVGCEHTHSIPPWHGPASEREDRCIQVSTDLTATYHIIHLPKAVNQI